MNVLTILFVAALLASAGLHIWLARRQIHYVREHRDTVPESFRDNIDLTAHRKAADYTIAKSRLSFASILINLVLAILWTIGGGLALLDETWQQLALGPLTAGVAVIASYALVSASIDLPLDIYSTFVTERRFGFNQTSARTYVGDRVKLLLLALILGVPLLYAVLFLMQHADRLWWLYVWLLWMAFTLALTWAYPVLIAPLFNKFTPLADADLKHRIEALLARCGFSSRGVFVMDGSARSAHGNAYFTGFGRNKRIVFFDTLMDKLAPQEIEAVLAHELGHFRLRHVVQQLVLSAILSLVGLAILGWLTARPWFYSGLGVKHASDYMALLLFSLLVPPLLFLLEPVMAAWSRLREYQADGYAMRQVDGQALINALVKLYRDNATTLTPDPWFSAFNDSHPPALVRIRALQRLLKVPSASADTVSRAARS